MVKKKCSTNHMLLLQVVIDLKTLHSIDVVSGCDVHIDMATNTNICAHTHIHTCNVHAHIHISTLQGKVSTLFHLSRQKVSPGYTCLV